MVRTALIRRAVSYGTAAMMTCFGLTGVVSAQSITNTGNGSTNTISSSTTDNCTVTNNNNVSATSSNNQSAVSGNSTSDGNTVSGLPWTGWSALDPAAAQANGQSYNAWFNGIINWVSNRSSGAGWNSSNTNLSWTPGSSDWGSFNPMTWQANGQSFGNWYNALQSYMNANSSTWALTWSGNGTGDGSLGTTTGDATNSNSVNFSITINNAASAAAGTNSCGQSNFTPPPVTGGMGGGPGISYIAPAAIRASSPHVYSYGGSGSGYYTPRYVATSYRAPAAKPSSSPAPVVAQSAPAAPSAPSAPVAPAAPSAPANSISNTGKDSHNTISSTTSSNYQVTNNNNVSATSNNTQTASTGSSTANGNTVAGGGGTGDASNGNSSGTGLGVSN